MSVTKEKRELIRQYIIDNVAEYPNNIVRKTAEEFGVTKSAVFKYIKKLISENILESTGERRNIIYRLKSTAHAVKLESSSDKAEDPKADKTETPERTVVEYKKSVPEEGGSPPHQKAGSKKTSLPSIAVVVVAIVIVLSLLFAFTSRQRQVKKLNAVLERIDLVETTLVELVKEGKNEKRERVLLELRKALLNFQDAKNLIADDALAKKLLTIEDAIKSALLLPEAAQEPQAPQGKEKQRVE